MQAARATAVLKRDGLGRVERIEAPGGVWVRRVACGGRVPGSRWVARLLLARERAALSALAGLARVPELADQAELARAPALDGRAPRPGDVLVRSWIEGWPLCAAAVLPCDFFEALEELVRALHARGVCHNDLHKEQNVIVGPDGWPALVDFQLASVHAAAARNGRTWRVRTAEDLRHVAKHWARYARRGPAAIASRVDLVPRAPRSRLAHAWRRFGKPVYNAVFGRMGWREREPRRASSGPWPAWQGRLAEEPARSLERAPGPAAR